MKSDVKATLRALRRSVDVRMRGEDLIIRGPQGEVDLAFDALRDSKREALAALRHEDRVLALTTAEFALQDHAIEFRLPSHDGMFWLVPTQRDVAILLDRGTPLGRIWTVPEFRALLDLPHRADAFRDAVALKLAANGPLVVAERHVEDDGDG